MFRRISYKIALQFTLFVFLLFMVNGALFLIADFANEQRTMKMHLGDTAQKIAMRIANNPAAFTHALPASDADFVRIVDTQGNELHSGDVYFNIPFHPEAGMKKVFVGDRQFGVYTAPYAVAGQPVGFVQVADVERFQVNDLPRRAAIYILVSIVISGLTFVVGLLFARRSLAPAEESMMRLEQFTQDASHELRTPLATANSSLDLAIKTKKYKEGIESAKEDLKQVSILVGRLLELARLGHFSMHKENIDFSTLVSHVTEKYQSAADEKKIVLKKEIQENVMIKGDEALLRQVISNLLSNAMKFTDKGGSVSVVLTNDELIVRDTGVGIPVDAVHRVFDRFYQADNSRSKEGFGLGLSLVKRIIELHGLSIAVESQEKKGTAFTINLRRAKA